MKKKLLLVLAAVFAVFSARISADFRNYAWTYQYMVMEPGETELEFYVTYEHSDLNAPGKESWKRQVEIETGLFHMVDGAVYLVESYKPSSGASKFSEMKLRLRAKLTENSGDFIVDPVIYAEYKIQTDRTYPDKVELKGIIAKDIGNLNLAFNIIPEESYRSGTKEKYWKTEYAGGACYKLFEGVFTIGAEIKGDFTGEKHSIGPVFSYQSGNFWISTSPVYGMNSKTDQMKMQSIAGIVF